ncbi:MAG TPA: DUF4388 domain-containing protein [Acidimicrobiales bacterium]|nr:DUF4388 domain-containing protein [Acidimicrobiales bacterium]
MPLAGTFDVLDFGEVLGLLSRQAATGRLQLRTVSMHGVIWLAEGRATAAEISSSAGSETRGKWRNQIEDICFDALRSPRGSFEFHPEDESNVPSGPRVRLETVLASGRRRLEMWQDVESVIHSFEAVPRMADSLSEEAVTLSQECWRVLVAVDGRRNVAALAKRLDIELLEFCQLLKPLVQSGAVVLDQPEGWLKSLPKVRLEIAGSDIDPETVVDPGSPDDAIAVLNVSSTPVPLARSGANGETAAPRTSSVAAPSTSPAGSSGTPGSSAPATSPSPSAPSPSASPAPSPSPETAAGATAGGDRSGRRRLRGRTRPRSAGAEINN